MQQASSRNSPRNNHTVVLQPRGVRVSQGQLLGSKQQYSPVLKNRTLQTHLQTHHTSRERYQKNTERRNTSPNTPEVTSDDRTDLLVRFGIDSIFGRVVTRILIALLLSQPVYVALGMELDESQGSETQSAEEASEPSPSVESQDESTALSEETDVPPDTNTILNTSTEEDVESIEEDENDNLDENTDSVNGGGSDNTSSEEESVIDEESDAETEEGTSDITEEETDTTTDEQTSDTTEEETTGTDDTERVDDDDSNATHDGDADIRDDTDSELDDTLDEEVIEGDDVDEEVTESDVVATSQNSDNKYVFGEGDCTLVSDGEFYCVANSATKQVTADPRVYSEKDREGDREIYYFDGVEVVRVTNNSYDDFAPVFEEETQRIIWQAMLNDRLQIMMYEIPTNTTRQITSSRQNSSNPSIMGDVVVWQEWIDTNWEILMTDVDNNGQEFEIEQLTDNAVHDMFPTMYDDMVTWQREKGASWEVVVYDVRSKKSHILEKDEDTKYENPRFVLLFDSKHNNGDIETIGYNLDTGEKMELGTRANPQPVTPASPKDEAPDAVPREEKTEVDIVVVDDTEGDGDDDEENLITTPAVDTDILVDDEGIDDEIVNDVQTDVPSVTTPVVLDDVIELAPRE